jgi:hypothetical protein
MIDTPRCAIVVFVCFHLHHLSKYVGKNKWFRPRNSAEGRILYAWLDLLRRPCEGWSQHPQAKKADSL